MVMIIVPSFSQSQNGENDIVSARIIRIISAKTEHVVKRIYRKGGVHDRDTGNKKSPDQHLYPVCLKLREECREHLTGQEKRNSKQDWDDDIKSVQPDKLGKLHPIFYIFIPGFKIIAIKNPSNVCPEESQL